MADEKPRLTLNDPVPDETIKKFEELAEARAAVAEQMLQLEQEKILLLATARQVDQQHRRLFQEVLTERGMAPGTKVDIDVKTGKLTLDEGAPAEPTVAKA